MPNEMPNPTEADLASPEFEAIWQVVKSWDVNVPTHYAGYCGANGSHVKMILDALRASVVSVPVIFPSNQEVSALAWEVHLKMQSIPGISAFNAAEISAAALMEKIREMNIPQSSMPCCGCVDPSHAGACSQNS